MNHLFRFLVIAFFVLAGITSSKGQWIKQNSGITASLTDVVVLDSTTTVAIGRDGSILKTTNSGETWYNSTAHLSYIKPWNAVSFFDDTTGCVVGDNGVIMTLASGGKGWRWHQIPANQKCLSVLQASKTEICIGTDSGWVFSTFDTAKTWHSEKISKWPVRAIFTYRGPTTLGVSKYALTPYSICTQYVIPSPSWDEKILQPFQGLGSEGYDAEYCNGGGAGFIVGVQGDLRAAPTILRKSMSDTEWTHVTTGIHGDGVFHGVSAPTEKVIYVCGSNGMIYKSSDGGDNWINQSSSTNLTLNAIYFYDDKKGFAVGDSGLILYTSNGGITGVNNDDNYLPQGYELKQNFPNPFNPSTRIDYSVPTDGNAAIKIFDVLGKEIITLVSGYHRAGKYNVRFSTNDYRLSSGVYFYQLKAGKFVSTKKILLMK